MGDRDYYRKEYMKGRGPFQIGFDNATVSLIIFNLVVFSILLGLYLIYLVIYDTAVSAEPAFAQDIHRNLNLPADASEYLFRPWTALSYMFTHFGFWRLFSNMIWLWGFGSIFQSIAGSDKVIPVYIYAGLTGALFFLVGSSIFDANLAPQMSGGTAAIVGIAVATTAMSPGYRLFPMLGNGIPLWILTAIFLVLDLGSISMSVNLVLAHIAAGLMGYLYVMMLKQGKDIGAWMNRAGNWVLELFSPEKKYRNKERETLYYKTDKKPFVKKPNLTQAKLDEILDKINQRGYESLTPEEKEFLKKASEHL